MFQRFALLAVILLGTVQSHAQSLKPEAKYWVFFMDKNVSDFQPEREFDPKAIERRKQIGLPFDESDVPVTTSYLEAVQGTGAELKARSRWFNAACIYANSTEVEQIRKFDFVSDVKEVGSTQKIIAGDVAGTYDPTESDVQLAEAQLKRMGASEFSENGIDGRGIRIAVFDIGFKSWKTNPAFAHIRDNKKILKTWDFVKNRDNVDGYNSHGTFVLSCIAGKIGDMQIGLATGAEFILARTETWTEFYSEEENWVEAAEWADREGADIINSSLGYTYHRYFREQMDGNHSLVTRAADLAAKKGILVVNAAGNDGNNEWKFIGAPADGDSVLSIGGIQPSLGVHTTFSSFGPTRDKRLKPNVCAYGHVTGSGPKGVSRTQGTSFSSPLVAGFAACAKQTRPGYSNMQLYDAIQKSGDLYPYFDYAHGYGVPQASYFMRMSSAVMPTFKFERTSSTVRIEIIDSSEQVEPTHEGYFVKWPEYVFYHIENKVGYLDKYFVVDGTGFDKYNFEPVSNEMSEEVDLKKFYEQHGPLVIDLEEFKRPVTIRAHYRGYTEELIIN